MATITVKRIFYEKDSPNGICKAGNLKKVDGEFEPCCLGLEKAVEDGFVGFGERDDMGLNKNDHVNIYDCEPYPEGAVWNEMAICFCPFCGARITREIQV